MKISYVHLGILIACISLVAFTMIQDQNFESQNNMDKQAKVGLEEAVQKLEEAARPYMEYFEHGTMRVGLYAPSEVDRQQPHDQDELYVVASGSGKFMADGVEHAFVQGDVLFVAAHADHRFTEFSSDFKTWVFFYGPEGGE